MCQSCLEAEAMQRFTGSSLPNTLKHLCGIISQWVSSCLSSARHYVVVRLVKKSIHWFMNLSTQDEGLQLSLIPEGRLDGRWWCKTWTMPTEEESRWFTPTAVTEKVFPSKVSFFTPLCRCLFYPFLLLLLQFSVDDSKMHRRVFVLDASCRNISFPAVNPHRASLYSAASSCKSLFL